ncbi:MAG: SPFH domain-containing protein, partial [Planctomycetota bacterium]
VDDPRRFLESVGTPEEAENKLEPMVAASKNHYVSQHDLSALVSTNAGDIRIPEIEQSILADLKQAAKEKYGVDVEQVGIKRIAYSEKNTEAVLRRMRAERQAVAGTIRSGGENEAQTIESEAMIAASETIQKANEEVGKIRAAGEAQAIQIIVQAQQKDPDFYEYWSTLRTLVNSIGSRTTLVLPTDYPVLKVLSGTANLSGAPSGSQGRIRPPSAAPADRASSVIRKEGSE